jgi:flagellar assembly factor FliW
LGDRNNLRDYTYHFEKGIYGFEDYKEYIISNYGGEDSPFQIMEAKEEEGLGFILIPPALIYKDYEIDVDDSELKTLEVDTPEDILVLSIVTFIDKNKISVNLKSPIIISIPSKKGKQIILDDDTYSVRHIVEINK